MSAQGVFTPDYRLTFVEKTAGQVGDGKEWPMLVTVDQLAEIAYRVKDGWFTSGEFTAEDAGTYYAINTYTGIPPADYASVTTGYNVVRAFTALDSLLVPYSDDYFGIPYTTTVILGADWRDTLNNERMIWLGDINEAVDIWRLGAVGIYTGDYNIYGFSHFLIYTGGVGTPPDYGIVDMWPDTSPPTDAVDTLVYLVFSGEVAWVDTNLSGNPFDPLNELYIGLKFVVNSGSSSFGQLSTLETDFVTPSDTGLYLKFQLASSVSQCKIYHQPQTGFSYNAVSDFVMTAQEWWPYAKGDPDIPVWDSLTGAKL